MEGKSRYSFAVMSTGRRPARTTEPQMVVTTTKGKIKLNEAASRLIGLQHGDHLTLVNNEADIIRAVAAGELEEGTPITWGLMKGYPVKDATGRVKQVVKRLTEAEKQMLIEDGEVDEDGNPLPQYEDKYVGFKLASNTKSPGVGVILEGSDAVNYEPLGGNSDENVIYEIEPESTSVSVEGVEREVFILGDKSTQPKIQRG